MGSGGVFRGSGSQKVGFEQHGRRERGPSPCPIYRLLKGFLNGLWSVAFAPGNAHAKRRKRSRLLRVKFPSLLAFSPEIVARFAAVFFTPRCCVGGSLSPIAEKGWVEFELVEVFHGIPSPSDSSA